MIEYYDRLSTHIDASSETVTQQIKSGCVAAVPLPPNCASPQTPTRASDWQSTDTRLAPKVSNAPNPPAIKPKNVRILSNNVQRMISHSNSLDEISETSRTLNLLKLRSFKGHPSGRSKASQINIPLSKNTCKLTQTGNELVDTFDPIECLETTALKSASCSDILEDNKLTPGNDIFLFCSKKQSTDMAARGSVETISITNFSNCSTNIKKIVQQLESNASNKLTAETNISMETLNSEDTMTSAKGKGPPSDSSDDLYHDCINEASNFHVKVPVELHETSKIEYFKKLSIDERKQKLFKRAVIEDKLPAAEKSMDSPKTDTLTKIELKEEPTTKNYITDKKVPSPRPIDRSDNVAAKPVPDIARLKHRPLSASSICSSSSSSSSGSEHLTGKLGISYLASVESLADHSESEQTHSGLTLCERACMEIIDSEKSYVADLGQVIKG